MIAGLRVGGHAAAWAPWTSRPRSTSLTRKLACELIGTFVLVFGGTGAAVLAAAYPQYGIGFAGVAVAFGLTVLGGAYALGPISGGHFNPAVTFGLCTGGRFPWRLLPGYALAQVAGAIIASAAGLAANGFGAHSPGVGPTSGPCSSRLCWERRKTAPPPSLRREV